MRRTGNTIFLLALFLIAEAAGAGGVKAIQCVCDVGCRYRSTLWFGIYPLKVETFKDYRVTLSTDADHCYFLEKEGFSCKDFYKKSPSLKGFVYKLMYMSCTPKGYCFGYAALGPDAPELSTLRGFRDEVLAQSRTGRELTDLYYRYSPALIGLLDANPGLRAYARDRLIEVTGLIHEHLYGRGIGDGEYEYLRSIIEEGFALLEDLARADNPGPRASWEREAGDNSVGSLLDDGTLARINVLIERLLKEMSDSNPEPLDRGPDSAGGQGSR